MQIGKNSDNGVHISGFYAIAAAAVGATIIVAGTIYVAYMQLTAGGQPQVNAGAPQGELSESPKAAEPGEPEPTPEAPPAEFVSVEVITQRVNQKFEDVEGGPVFRTGDRDRATFLFRVRNLTEAPIDLHRIKVLIDNSTPLKAVGSTKLSIERMDHREHIQAFVGNPMAGDQLDIPVSLRLPAKSVKEFTVWFRSESRAPVLQISGRLRLLVNGTPVDSEPLDIEIHTEVNSMRSNEV